MNTQRLHKSNRFWRNDTNPFPIFRLPYRLYKDNFHTIQKFGIKTNHCYGFGDIASRFKTYYQYKFDASRICNSIECTVAFNVVWQQTSDITITLLSVHPEGIQWITSDKLTEWRRLEMYTNFQDIRQIHKCSKLTVEWNFHLNNEFLCIFPA